MDSETRAAVLDELVAHNIPHAVLRGVEPECHATSDVDLLVPGRSQNVTAQQIISRVLIDRFDVVVTCRHVDVPVIWAADYDSPGAVCEWDVCESATWAFSSLLDPVRVVTESIPTTIARTPRRGDMSALLGVPAILGSRYGRETLERRLPEIQAHIASDPAGATRAWTEAIGYRRMALRLLDDLMDPAPFMATRRLAILRAACLGRRFAAHPLGASLRVTDVLVRRAWRARCGLWSARGARLQPIRKAGIGPEQWTALLDRVKARH
jgi:hypothetical protein